MGAAAHGDEDALAAEALLFAAVLIHHAHAVGIGEASPAAHQLHAGFLQKPDVQLVEPIHLGAHTLQQLSAVVGDIPHAPAVAGGVMEVVAHGRAVHHQFFGHAAANHAGAAHPIPFHNRHPGAITGGALGGGEATGAGADHHQVEMLTHARRRRRANG